MSPKVCGQRFAGRIRTGTQQPNKWIRIGVQHRKMVGVSTIGVALVSIRRVRYDEEEIR